MEEPKEVSGEDYARQEKREGIIMDWTDSKVFFRLGCAKPKPQPFDDWFASIGEYIEERLG